MAKLPVLLWLCPAVLAGAVSGSIRLSNTALPVDLAGRPLTTGEASVLLAPVGARLAHRLPQHWLQRAFAALLLVIGVTMVSGAV